MKYQKSLRLLLGVLRFAPLFFVTTLVHGAVFQFHTALSGGAESPPNSSAGTGWAEVYFDTTAQSFRIETAFSGLTGDVTAAHIHAATAVANTGNVGVATQLPTFAGFPLGVTSGAYDQTFALTNPTFFNAAYITANGGTTTSASAALLNALLDQKAYLNIHSTAFPAGEIRGFLHQVPSTVPDGASTALLIAIALMGIAGFSRVRDVRY